uniref:NUDIX hydrolase n=1 Tax=Marseillevirus LCMAC103 TaxID=2506604 RepID=A0A481YVP8_9VIRU|nr:MAG: NUDIX hydrolase [Marseillevirus LCMAC103]
MFIITYVDENTSDAWFPTRDEAVAHRDRRERKIFCDVTEVPKSLLLFSRWPQKPRRRLYYYFRRGARATILGVFLAARELKEDCARKGLALGDTACMRKLMLRGCSPPKVRACSQKEQDEVAVMAGRDLDPSPLRGLRRRARCGVIPYTIRNDRAFFLLARDARTSDICDFGGGVKGHETPREGAMREFKEESLAIFGALYDNADIFSPDVCLASASEAIIFHPVEPVWLDTAVAAFRDAWTRGPILPCNEVADVFWASEHNFTCVVAGERRRLAPCSVTNRGDCEVADMWDKLRRFLQHGLAVFEGGDFLVQLKRVQALAAK